MIFYRAKETTDYLLKDELLTESELTGYNQYFEMTDLEKIEISKTETMRILGKRFQAKKIVM